MRVITNILIVFFALFTVAACGDDMAYGPCGATCGDDERCVEADDGKFQCEAKAGEAVDDTPSSLNVESSNSSTTVDSSSSDNACSGIIDCLGNCSAGDEACANRCLDSGDSESQQRVVNAVTCVQERCDGQACVACEAQITACEVDEAVLGCGDFFGCADVCETQECIEVCFGNTSDDGMRKVETVLNCWELNCQGVEDCNACTSEENACLNG